MPPELQQVVTTAEELLDALHESHDATNSTASAEDKDKENEREENTGEVNEGDVNNGEGNEGEENNGEGNDQWTIFKNTIVDFT